MSRKHFKAIAEAIRNIRDENARKESAEALASVCAANNPRFDRSRFLEACGVQR